MGLEPTISTLGVRHATHFATTPPHSIIELELGLTVLSYLNLSDNSGFILDITTFVTDLCNYLEQPQQFILPFKIHL